MKDNDLVYQQLNLFHGMIYSACKMASWCFNIQNKDLFYTICPFEDEFLSFLNVSGCLDYAISMERDMTKPLILSDNIGLTWVADYIWDNNQPTLLIVIGPVFTSESSINGIEDSLRKMNFSISARNSLMQKLSQIPILTINMLNQYIAMLHHIITGEIINVIDYNLQSTVSDAKYSYDNQYLNTEENFENKFYMDKVRIIEETILQAIRDGNINFSLDKITDSQGNMPASPDSYNTNTVQRNEKNTVIIFTALCSRAAMDGGLSPRTAKNMEVYYITKVEEVNTITDLINLNSIMLNDFIKKVHECKIQPQISKPIQDCCDYINKNIRQQIDLSELAKDIGYTEYYLSRKFYNEMGVKINDYIKNQKIQLAKISLASTNKSIQEISDQMNFSTRSHFSRLFSEKVGMSPAEYRNKAKTVNDI